MRFVEKVMVDIPGVKQEFKLGDITIFIGRSNSGKTRILNKIYQIFSEYNAFIDYSPDGKPSLIYPEKTRTLGFANMVSKNASQFKLMDEHKGPVSISLVPSYRPAKQNMNSLAITIARLAETARVIDPTICDFGTSEIERENGERRQLQEQGSGLSNLVHIFEALGTRINLLLLDEPEISQFPYGKVELLKFIIDKSRDHQIVISTHDPTLINQYLIRKFATNGPNIVIYSFSGNEFKKIDFTACEPEIHVGYLSQSYSAKPVHLIVEGPTEYYAFQALLFKYAEAKSVPHYPKFINKIAISYIAGSQWEINRHHLPDPRYYDVLVVLDGEHERAIEETDFGTGNAIVTEVPRRSNGQVNWYTLKSRNIEDAFSKVFSPVSEKKPVGLSLQIWSMDGKKIPEEISEILKWCLERAGAKIPGVLYGPPL